MSHRWWERPLCLLRVRRVPTRRPDRLGRPTATQTAERGCAAEGGRDADGRGRPSRRGNFPHPDGACPGANGTGRRKATRVRLTEGGTSPDRRSNLCTATRRLHTVTTPQPGIRINVFCVLSDMIWGVLSEKRFFQNFRGSFKNDEVLSNYRVKKRFFQEG